VKQRLLIALCCTNSPKKKSKKAFSSSIQMGVLIHMRWTW